MLGLVDNLNAYISATQLGITLAWLALGWIGEPAVAHLLELPLKNRVSDTVLHTIAFTIAFSIITFLHIVEWHAYRSRRQPALKLQLPEDGGYITLAGFLLAQAGRLLHEGETVKDEGMRFKVEQVDKRRIRKIRFSLQEDKQISKLALVPLISTAMNETLLIAQ